jgi:PEGA domain-containing protein
MTRPSRLLLLVTLFTTLGLGWASDAAAQRRAPPGSRTGVAVPRSSPPRYYRPYYNSRYYYPYYSRYYYPYYRPYYYPYYSSFAFSVGFGFGWPGYWGASAYPYGYPYAYPYAYGYPYPYYGYDNTGSARLLISPRNAQVYVDGRFVGLVDEFDGSLQRLHVETGQHEVQIYLEGYRTFTEKVLFTRGTTLKIQHVLEPLAPGEQATEPKPAPDRPAPDRTTPPRDRYENQRPMPAPRAGERTEFGTLSLRVNPRDAVILVDGETWDRPEGEDRFSIDLAAGPHQVEVRKDGYRSYTRTVDVFPGRTFTLNVSLTPGGPGQVSARRAVPVTVARRSAPTDR